jgi:hypothetical protein
MLKSSKLLVKEPECMRGPTFFILHICVLTWQPTFLSSFLQGAFYPLENLTDPPFSPVPFVLPALRDSMLYIGISEYFFRSASFAHFTAGAFSVTLSTKEVSRASRWWQWHHCLTFYKYFMMGCLSFDSWSFIVLVGQWRRELKNDCCHQLGSCWISSSSNFSFFHTIWPLFQIVLN